MKYARIICRILLGLVFIFSGFVKGIDPMGSVIKFSEYFEIWHLTWLSSFSIIPKRISQRPQWQPLWSHRVKFRVLLPRLKPQR